MISIFSMIKNEIDIIDKFIMYHLKLCDQLILVDNGSTDGTQQRIEIFQSQYPKKIKSYQNHQPFSSKAQYLSQLMNECSKGILIPLDADEILAYEDMDGNIIFDYSFIQQYLIELQDLYQEGKFKVKNIYNYIPNTNNWFDTSDASKMFFLKNDFISTDAGFHNGITKSEKTIYTDIVYLHFHYRNKEAWLKSSKQKLQARLGDKWNDLNTLLEYKKPRPSSHIALEYSNYILTDKWHNLKPKKHIDIGNL